MSISDHNHPNRREFLSAAGAGLLGASVMNADPPLAPPDKQPPHVMLPEAPVRPTGFAIVGLGQLALEEVLPAFALCHRAKLVGLVSGHPEKAKRVAVAYGVDPKNIYDYDNCDRIADNPAIEVVYVILPNSMHAEYTIRGLKAVKHVLCEKPMAPTVAECEQMIAAATAVRRQLMIAYRLHYEPFNMAAIDLCRSGSLGAIKTISAGNGQDVAAPNIRLSKTLAGGPVGDVGIYCLNAARYLTGQEPVSVSAVAHQSKDDPRFREVPETVAFTLQFPGGTTANCECSFGSAENRWFRVTGTKGGLVMDGAFGYRGQKLTVTTEDGRQEKRIRPVNHFAAEMDHFAECVTSGKECRTPGREGLADMRWIAAITESAANGRRVTL